MNSLITYLASTHFFFCFFFFFTIKILKTDITNSVSTLCILLCPAIWLLFFLLNFSYQSGQTISWLQNTMDTFLPSFFTSTPSQSSLMILPPILCGRISKSYVLGLWLFYLDIAFLGDRFYFLSLMISILHKRKLRFRKKKISNFP